MDHTDSAPVQVVSQYRITMPLQCIYKHTKIYSGKQPPPKKKPKRTVIDVLWLLKFFPIYRLLREDGSNAKTTADVAWLESRYGNLHFTVRLKLAFFKVLYILGMLVMCKFLSVIERIENSWVALVIHFMSPYQSAVWLAQTLMLRPSTTAIWWHAKWLVVNSSDRLVFPSTRVGGFFPQ